MIMYVMHISVHFYINLGFMGTVTDYRPLKDSLCKRQTNGSRTVSVGIKSAQTVRESPGSSPVRVMLSTRDKTLTATAKLCRKNESETNRQGDRNRNQNPRES